MDTIFVQIASYKDPELPKTIDSCIKNAAYPERLRFGICWQKTDTENLCKYVDDPRFRIHSVDWKESRGVGWARSICNSLYQFEDYTLQIDSHIRFKKNWDIELINQWTVCNHPKAVISIYPPKFEYEDLCIVYDDMCTTNMIVKGFDYGFVPTFKNGIIHKSVDQSKPIRGSFIAAGFMFTIGKSCIEVPYMKDVYFIGEEVVHSLRLFTHGYRVFHPTVNLLWHLYERKNVNRHWDDFTDTQLKRTLDTIQLESIKTLRCILQKDSGSVKCLGDVSSFDDFENYSGISIKNRVIHPDMLLGYEPPYSTDNKWVNVVNPFKLYDVNLSIDLSLLIDKTHEYDFIYFGLHDDTCNELHRDDFRDIDVSNLTIKYCNSIMLRTKPVKYIIWPHTKSGEWEERVVFNIPENNIKCA